MPYAHVSIRFHADTQQECLDLGEELLIYESDVLCPASDERLHPCGTCDGTLVNPDDGTFEPGTDPDDWAPGMPCWQCHDSEHPGQEMPCAREHVSSLSVLDDHHPLDPEDYRLREVLVRARDLLQADPGTALQFLSEQIEQIDQDEAEMLTEPASPS